SVKARRQVFAEANHRCSFVHPESGIACNSIYQLQVDHIIAFIEGGSDKVSNLRVLCGIHNRSRACS
ncbi:MAG: HNH endonuclease, partial [Bdellovibrionaceae bacterium]|nr:HNH endonuclease [Pseudobdellovibrionaceae bacterium]